MQAVPDLKRELQKYDDDSFLHNTSVGYYHYYRGEPKLYHLHGEQMSSQQENEAVEAINKPHKAVKLTVFEPENNPNFSGFRS